MSWEFWPKGFDKAVGNSKIDGTKIITHFEPKMTLYEWENLPRQQQLEMFNAVCIMGYAENIKSGKK